jgi:hypothetical protein
LGVLAASAGPAAAQRPPPVIEKSWRGREGRGSINFSFRKIDGATGRWCSRWRRDKLGRAAQSPSNESAIGQIEIATVTWDLAA